MTTKTRLAIEAALAGIDTAKSRGAANRVKAREHYEFVAMDDDMRQLLQEHDAEVSKLTEQVRVLLNLHGKTDLLIAEIGKEGEIDRRNPLVEAVLNALYDCDKSLNQSPKE